MQTLPLLSQFGHLCDSSDNCMGAPRVQIVGRAKPPHSVNLPKLHETLGTCIAHLACSFQFREQAFSTLLFCSKNAFLSWVNQKCTASFSANCKNITVICSKKARQKDCERSPFVAPVRCGRNTKRSKRDFQTTKKKTLMSFSTLFSFVNRKRNIPTDRQTRGFVCQIDSFFVVEMQREQLFFDLTWMWGKRPEHPRCDFVGADPGPSPLTAEKKTPTTNTLRHSCEIGEAQQDILHVRWPRILPGQWFIENQIWSESQ